MHPPVAVITIGHAIVDVLAPSPDALAATYGMDKGTMTLIEETRAKELYDALGPAVESSGGSAANTAAGIAALGGTAAFLGKVRDDKLGEVFAHDIRAAGVRFDVVPATSGPATGLCLVMVHPDAQRTMATYLGTGGLLYARDIDADACAAAQVVYLEGYMVGLPETEAAVAKAARACHRGGGRFALSLSDPYWVELKTAELDALLERVDILFGNEDEVTAMTGLSLEAAIVSLPRRCDLVVVTRGPAGSLVAFADQVVAVDAHPVDTVVDTTGAGDMFAAGFLYGLTHGFDPGECAQLGSLAAAEVIGHLGARPQASLRDLLVASGLGGPWTTPG